MSVDAERDAADVVDVPGIVLASTAVLAAIATFLVTPGSGAGPAAVAVMAWLAVLAAASWAALVDDRTSTWRRLGATALAATVAAGFVATVESGWALVIPGIVVAGALGRRKSRARFVALAACLLAGGYIILRATSR